MRKLIAAVGATALLSLAALSAPAQAQPHLPIIQTQVYVAPPPARRYYAPPPPRYVHPGYYNHGPRYRPPPRHWERRHGARRDNDGDGVPNRYDRRPNNPYRY